MLVQMFIALLFYLHLNSKTSFIYLIEARVEEKHGLRFYMVDCFNSSLHSTVVPRDARSAREPFLRSSGPSRPLV
jgi:hypothetical protein